MTDDTAKRVTDLENRIARAQGEARACVQELLVDDDARYLVAERLPALGSAVLPAIRELLDDPGVTSDVRALAALVGFEVGDREQSLMVLLEEIRHRGEFAPLAARRLSRAGRSDAAGVICEALRGTDHKDVDPIVSYLEALHDLGVRIDDDDRRRLLAGGAWQIETAIAQWHAAASPDE